MNEKFKNELTLQLSNAGISDENIRKMLQCFDIVSYSYDMKEKETQIIPYNDELPNLAKQFLVVKSVKGLAEGTLYGYKKHLENFFFQVKKDPTQITKSDIEIYLYWYKKTRNISDRSLDKVLDCFKSFYNWMYVNEYVNRDPARIVESIKYTEKPQTVLTETELEIVRRSCITPKEKALVEFLFSTGCRIAEVARLKKSDVNFVDKTVNIFGKGKKYRTGFLNVRAEFALLDYLRSRKDDTDYLFVSDRAPHENMSVAGLEKIIRNISKRADINKNVTAHCFRRTTATLLRNRGMSVEVIQQILGHEKINTTMIYTQVSLQSVQAQYKQYMF